MNEMNENNVRLPMKGTVSLLNGQKYFILIKWDRTGTIWLLPGANVVFLWHPSWNPSHLSEHKKTNTFYMFYYMYFCLKQVILILQKCNVHVRN
jgi:hypothetical protein